MTQAGLILNGHSRGCTQHSLEGSEQREQQWETRETVSASPGER